jgi:hypothetical protein
MTWAATTRVQREPVTDGGLRYLLQQVQLPKIHIYYIFDTEYGAERFPIETSARECYTD